MTFRSIQNGFFLVLVVLTTLAFLGLIQDFLQPVFWAAVLAILFYPMQRWWTHRLGDRPALAAVVTILIIVVIVILPLVLIGIAVAHESVAIYERVASGELDVRAPLELAERGLPVLDAYLERFGIDADRIMEGISGAAVTSSRFLASRMLTIGQNALRVTALAFLMLYILFFFLRDGEKLLEEIVRVLPLGDDRERRLFDKFSQVTRATIKGTLVVGAIQGTLGGLLFWAVGIAAPVFWGVIMTVLSLLPAVGSALVWLPAAIILMVTGEVVRGIILIVVGTLVIGLVDNILRPLLVGRDTKMPDFLILLSTLGGLTVFGLSGFVIGPIIAAFFLVVWDMFREEYGERDDVPLLAEPVMDREEPVPPSHDGDDTVEARARG